MHKKGLTTFLSLGTFLISALTGVVLYFEPQGRVAYWTLWEFLGLTKTQWDNLHLISSIAFSAIVLYHLVLNWNVFTSYIKKKAARAFKLKAEMAVALIITTVITIGSITLVPPFNYIVDFSGYLKDSWVKNKNYEPPYGHAELTPFKAFAMKMDIPLSEALEALAAKGIEFDDNTLSLAELSAKFNTSPMVLYGYIKHLEPQPQKHIIYTPDEVEARFAGTGIGNQEINWIIKDQGLNPAVVQERLRRNGLITPMDISLKKLANQYNSEPMEIMKIILIDEYVLAPN